MTRCSMRMAWYVSVVTCLVVAVATELFAQSQRPYLARIARRDWGVAELLEERAVPVNARLEHWYIAQVTEEDLDLFRKEGIVSQIIDTEAWSQPYFLISRPRGARLGTVPEAAIVVHQDLDEAIVKIPAGEAVKLRASGFRLARLWPESLPLAGPTTVEAKPVSVGAVASDVIGTIINQVSTAVLRSSVQRLQDFQTRYVGTDSLDAAAQWIYDRFAEYGYTDVQFEVFQAEGFTVKNVIATKPGILYPDSVIIIGGHYDSIVYDGTNPRVFAPGADDNASGTAAAMEAARILANVELDCTVRFAAWTAEEIGLYGSGHHAQKAHAQKEKIGLYINLDMIGNLGSDSLRTVNIMRNGGAMHYGDMMAELATRYTTLVPVMFYDTGGPGDHYHFSQRGYSIVYCEEGDFSPNYHCRTDVVENLDIPYLSEVVTIALALLATVAGPPDSYPGPVIVFRESVLDDDDQGGSIGNGNGHFDAGETVEVTVTLENVGGSGVSGVSGLLMTEDPYVTIVDTTRFFGDIPPAGSISCAQPFRFRLSTDTPNGRYLNFSIRVTSAVGQQWMSYFSVQVKQPAIMYRTFHYSERTGDGDGIFDSGETIALSVNLINVGLRQACGVTARLSTDDDDIGILVGEVQFPDVMAGSSAENLQSPFSLSLDEEASEHAVLLTVHLSETEGYFQTDFPFRLLIGQGKILLVADDGGVGNINYYSEVLGLLGIPYDVEDKGLSFKSASGNLSSYAEVIWFTGPMEENTLTPDDQVALQAYLDGGGRLLISGSMLGYDIGSTSFYRQYLHGRYVSFMTMLHHLKSAPAHLAVDEMEITLASRGLNAQHFAAETDPVSPAVSIFNYDRTTAEGPGIIRSSGSGALAVETSEYKVVYVSFGLEGVEPAEGRVQIISDVLMWFKKPGIDKGDVDGNGVTNVLDVMVAVNIVLGIVLPSEEVEARADLDYNGVIDILDVIQVVNAVLAA